MDNHYKNVCHLNPDLRQLYLFLLIVLAQMKSDNNLCNNSFIKCIILPCHLTPASDHPKLNRKFQGKCQTKLNKKLKLFCLDLILIMVRESQTGNGWIVAFQFY